MNYPVLIHVRSAQPQRNWLVALLAVLDSAAIQLATNPQAPQGPARVVLRQGITTIRDIARAEGIPVDDDPSPDDPIALPYEEFAGAILRLQSLGYTLTRDVEEAWPHFRGWRINYEGAAYELARRIDAVPVVWSGPRTPPLPAMEPLRQVNRLPGGGSGRPVQGQ